MAEPAATWVVAAVAAGFSAPAIPTPCRAAAPAAAHSRILQEAPLAAASAAAGALGASVWTALGAVAAIAAAVAAAVPQALTVPAVAAAPLTRAPIKSWSPISGPAMERWLSLNSRQRCRSRPRLGCSLALLQASLLCGDCARAEPRARCQSGPDPAAGPLGDSQTRPWRRYSAATRRPRSGNSARNPSREAGQMPRSVMRAVTRRAGVTSKA